MPEDDRTSEQIDIAVDLAHAPVPPPSSPSFALSPIEDYDLLRGALSYISRMQQVSVRDSCDPATSSPGQAGIGDSSCQSPPLSGEIDDGSGARPAGAGQSPFPQTPWTLVLEAANGATDSADEALRRLCLIYESPIRHWLLRRGTRADEADDITHGFIEHLLERNRLQSVERRESKFRSFLLRGLQRFIWDQYRRRSRAQTVPLEETDVPDSTGGADSQYDTEFALRVHERALARLAEQFDRVGRRERFLALRPFILGRDGTTSYELVGRRLGLKANAVKKAVFDLRDGYCEAFRQEVLDTVPREALKEEMRYLLTLVARGHEGAPT